MLLKFKAIPEQLRFSWKLKEESEIIVLLFASPSGKGSTQLETLCFEAARIIKNKDQTPLHLNIRY